MRLVTFSRADGGICVGALVEDDSVVVDLALAYQTLTGATAPTLDSMLALIEGGEAALELARRALDEAPDAARYDRKDVALLAPLPVPAQMRDFMGFEKHVRQGREVAYRKIAAREADPEKAFEAFRARGNLDPPKVWFDQPIYYKCNRFSVVGPDSDVKWPRFAELMDYELEIGAVIGRPGVDITADTARDHIFGYTIFNDFSARDTQMAEMRGQLGPAKGKDFDTGNVLGPCLVTADEIPDPYDLVMTARVNGQEVARGNSGEMHHRFEDMIAHVSQDETLYPGEFIGSGTLGGGSGIEYDRYLSPGDVIELEIERIGVLRNRLIRPEAST